MATVWTRAVRWRCTHEREATTEPAKHLESWGSSVGQPLPSLPQPCWVQHLGLPALPSQEDQARLAADERSKAVLVGCAGACIRLVCGLVGVWCMACHSRFLCLHDGDQRSALAGSLWLGGRTYAFEPHRRCFGVDVALGALHPLGWASHASLGVAHGRSRLGPWHGHPRSCAMTDQEDTCRSTATALG